MYLHANIEEMTQILLQKYGKKAIIMADIACYFNIIKYVLEGDIL
jgi:hypothetical protein